VITLFLKLLLIFYYYQQYIILKTVMLNCIDFRKIFVLFLRNKYRLYIA